MIRLVFCCAAFLGGCANTPASQTGVTGPGAARSSEVTAEALVHDVYFTLRDASPGARAELIAACEAQLATLPGVLQLTAGSREPSLVRDVNVVDFDVALRVVFADLAAHDAYQAAPAHVALVERFRANFERVRIFDSTVRVWSPRR